MTGDCDQLEHEHDLEKLAECWVFGYGSILWNPGFSYASRHTGYVEGYARRFWQGSTTHRGTPQSPGRVATLIQHKGERVWGSAFHLVGSSMIEACLRYLGLRECHLGGYEVLPVTFISADTATSGTLDVNESTPRRSESSSDEDSEDLEDSVAFSDEDSKDSVPSSYEDSELGNNCGRWQAWAFIATPDNSHYLGPAPVEEVASQVLNSYGSSGPNSDYVLRLADYIRTHIPQDTDVHLFELDSKIRQLMSDMHYIDSPSSRSDLDIDDLFRPTIETNETSSSSSSSTPSSTTSTVSLADMSSAASMDLEEDEDRPQNNGNNGNNGKITMNLNDLFNCITPVMSAAAGRLTISTSVVSVRAC